MKRASLFKKYRIIPILNLRLGLYGACFQRSESIKFEVLSTLLEDLGWAQVHPLGPQPYTDTTWPGVQYEIGPNPRVFHVTKIHIGPKL